jgi:hypothetical protein
MKLHFSGKMEKLLKCQIEENASRKRQDFPVGWEDGWMGRKT